MACDAFFTGFPKAELDRIELSGILTHHGEEIAHNPFENGRQSQEQRADKKEDTAISGEGRVSVFNRRWLINFR